MTLDKLQRLTDLGLKRMVTKAIRGRKWTRRIARACNRHLYRMRGEPNISDGAFEAFLIRGNTSLRERNIALLLALDEEKP